MSFQLTIIDSRTESVTIYPLAVGDYHLGQSLESNIVLTHPFVAENHALLTVTETAVFLTDLGSSSGTTLDDHRLPPQQIVELKSGSVAEIALFLISVEEVVGAAEPEPEPEPIQASLANGGNGRNNSNGNGNGNDNENGNNPWAHLEKVGLREEAFSRYVQYLPAIYDTPFMHRFLGIFESILSPIVWRIDNLDFYLDGRTAPPAFLPWLANWYSLTFDASWEEAQRRQLLRAAPRIFGYWGTPSALKTVLEIYLQQSITIIDDESLPPFTFQVNVPLPPDEIKEAAVAKLINSHKPAHTSFRLHFTG